MLESQPPNILIFKGNDYFAAAVSQLFTGRSVEPRLLSYQHEWAQEAEFTLEDIDIVVLPARLSNGEQPDRLIAELHQIPQLQNIALVVITDFHERSYGRFAFEAGADFVYQLPIDSDSFFMQILALSRFRRRHTLLQNAEQDALALKSATVSLLNALSEGLVVYDGDLNPIFANQIARSLVGLTSSSTAAERQSAKALLAKLVHSLPRSFLKAEEPSVHDLATEIVRLDGQRFRAVLRCTQAFGENGAIAGYAVGLKNLSTEELLATMLRQGENYRPLLIFACAHLAQTLRAESGALPLSPISSARKALDADARNCKLNDVLTCLTDMIDQSLGSGISLKLSGALDQQIALSMLDSLQILGQLLFFAAHQGAIRAEIRIGAEPCEDPNWLRVLISASWPVRVKAESRSSMQLLIEGFLDQDLGTAVVEANPAAKGRDDILPTKLPSALELAQTFAQRCGVEIEYKQVESGLKLRVLLPKLPQQQPPTGETNQS